MDAPPTHVVERDAPGTDGPTLAERLERGQVLVWRPGALALPPDEDLEFLRSELGSMMTLKNISWHPDGDYVSGLSGAREPVERAVSILRRHHAEVTRFLAGHLAEYAHDWEQGKVNFRPLEEQGRDLSRHSSNELLHVDAFASGATHGRRILRFFTNVHPTDTRRWRSAGTFEALFREFGARAGIAGLGARGLRERVHDRAFSGLVRTLRRAGVPQAAAVDSSPYDRAMKRFHDFLKDDDAFQADEDRVVHMEFPPYTSWAVLTDGVSHAVERGRHALVCTYHVALERCARPELAPWSILAASG